MHVVNYNILQSFRRETNKHLKYSIEENKQTKHKLLTKAFTVPGIYKVVSNHVHTTYITDTNLWAQKFVSNTNKLERTPEDRPELTRFKLFCSDH